MLDESEPKGNLKFSNSPLTWLPSFLTLSLTLVQSVLHVLGSEPRKKDNTQRNRINRSAQHLHHQPGDVLIRHWADAE